MQLKGLKANFLGDSITEGVGVKSVDQTYWSVFKRKFGLAEARCYGISGTRIARQHNPTTDKQLFDLDFCSRVAEMDADADLVVVFGGTNDYGHGNAPLGQPSDRTPDTFWGACHTLMRSLMEKYPAATIVIMTPLHRAEETEPRFIRSDGCKPCLVDFVRILREAADFYGLPVVDLYAASGIQPQIPENRDLFAPDGLHPNAAGAERIADRLGNFLLAL